MVQRVEFEGQTLEFPDDITPEEIQGVLSQQFGGGAPSPTPLAGNITPTGELISRAALTDAPSQQPTRTGTAQEQFLGGITDIGTGITQNVLNPLLQVLPIGDRDKKRFDAFTQRVSRQKKLQDIAGERGAEEFPVTAFGSRVAGQVIALPVPGGQGSTFVVRTGNAAATGALAGFLQPVDEDEDPRMNALIGALAGGAFQGVSEPFARQVRKLINASDGVFNKPQLAALIKQADEKGIPIFADDIVDSPFVRFASRAAEEIPLTGTSPNRVAQAQAQKGAVEELIKGLRHGIKGAGDDVDVTDIQLASVIQKFDARRATKNKLWQRVIDKAGRGTVNLDRTRNAAMRELIDHVAQATNSPVETVQAAMGPILAGRSSINTLTQVLDNTPAGDSGLVRELFKFVRSPEGTMKYTIQDLKPSLNQLINKGTRGEQAVIKDKSVAILQRVKEALDADVGQFATRNPGVKSALDKANRFTTRFNIEGKKTVLKQILSEGGQETPEKMMNVLARGNKSENKLIFRNLTNEGRAAVKVGILEDAFEKSLDEQGNFLANKFNRQLDKSATSIGVFFKGKDKLEVEGLRKVLQATEAASRQFGEGVGINVLGRRLLTPNLAQGAQAGVVSGAGIVGGVPGAATAAAGILGTGGVIRLAVQSETGRAILAGLGRSTPGTKAFDAQVNALNAFLTRQVVIAMREDQESGAN